MKAEELDLKASLNYTESYLKIKQQTERLFSL